jgi:hypothetical protein
VEKQPGVIMSALATLQGKRVASAPIDDLFGDHPLAHRRIDRDVLTPLRTATSSVSAHCRHLVGLVIRRDLPQFAAMRGRFAPGVVARVTRSLSADSQVAPDVDERPRPRTAETRG